MSKILSSKSSSFRKFFSVCSEYSTMMLYTYIISPKYSKWGCRFPKYYSITECNYKQEVSPVFPDMIAFHSLSQSVCAIPCSCLADDLWCHTKYLLTPKDSLSPEKMLLTALLRTSLQCAICLPLSHLLNVNGYIK